MNEFPPTEYGEMKIDRSLVPPSQTPPAPLDLSSPAYKTDEMGLPLIRKFRRLCRPPEVWQYSSSQLQRCVPQTKLDRYSQQYPFLAVEDENDPRQLGPKHIVYRRPSNELAWVPITQFVKPGSKLDLYHLWDALERTLITRDDLLQYFRNTGMLLSIYAQFLESTKFADRCEPRIQPFVTPPRRRRRTIHPPPTASQLVQRKRIAHEVKLERRRVARIKRGYLARKRRRQRLHSDKRQRDRKQKSTCRNLLSEFNACTATEKPISEDMIQTAMFMYENINKAKKAFDILYADMMPTLTEFVTKFAKDEGMQHAHDAGEFTALETFSNQVDPNVTMVTPGMSGGLPNVLEPFVIAKKRLKDFWALKSSGTLKPDLQVLLSNPILTNPILVDFLEKKRTVSESELSVRVVEMTNPNPGDL